MSDLVEFLTARLDQIELAAKTCSEVYPGPWELSDRGWMAKVSADEPNYRIITQLEQNKSIEGGWLGDYLEHIAFHDPTQVLADVAAKRALIEYAYVAESTLDMEFGCAHTAEQIRRGECHAGQSDQMEIFRILASAYRGHYDYQEAWAPSSSGAGSPSPLP